MLKKVFNWLHDTTLVENNKVNPAGHRGIGFTGNLMNGMDTNDKYERMKAVLYLGVR